MKNIGLFITFIAMWNFAHSQTHFSASQTESCGSFSVTFTNNIPSNGYMPQPFETTGYTYNWNFGNGQTSTAQNPPAVNYTTTGDYMAHYTCVIDTQGFYLTGLLVNQINCNDPLGGKPDPFIIIRDNTSTVVFSTESSYINDQNPPYTWAMNIKLDNPPYFVWVWDYDSLDGNDNCVDDSENEPGTSTVLTLPANNSSGFGSTIVNYTNGGLVMQAYFQKNVSTHTDSVEITVHELPAEPAINIPVASYCLGETLPSLVASASGNNVINWYNDAALTQLLHNGPIYNPTSTVAGTYEFYATQTDTSTGCVSEASSSTLTIAPLAPPVLNMYSGNYCTGQVLPELIATGNFIQWYNDSLLTNLIGTGDTLQIPDMPIGTYKLYATQTDTSRNCISNAAIFTMTFIQGIEADITVTNVSCFGNADGAITVTPTQGLSPYTYNWFHGPTTNEITGLSGGEYVLTILDGNFCLQLFSGLVSEPEDISLVHSAVDNPCYGSSQGSISLSVTGGTNPYAYAWSNGQTVANASNLGAGVFTVTVTDFNSCTTTQSIEISQPDSIHVEFTVVKESCNGSNDGSIVCAVNGGISPYTYLWSNTRTSESINDLHTGNYLVTISDANFCTKNETITISSVYDFCLDIPNVITPNGDGNNDTWKIRFIDMYSQCVVKVYNRWGQTVFENTGYTEAFDGTWNGKELPVGSYYYIIDLKSGGDNSVYNGTLDIIR